jgi:hypothetical protein
VSDPSILMWNLLCNLGGYHMIEVRVFSNDPCSNWIHIERYAGINGNGLIHQEGRQGMAVKVQESENGKVLEVYVTGKLSEEDYGHFVPEVERLLKREGKISIVFEMSQFHGWEPGALWADVKFDFKHHGDIERLALVGDRRWQEWMAKFCRPFTTARIRYFDHSDSQAARLWVEGAIIEEPVKAS